MVIERGEKIGARRYAYKCKCDSCSTIFSIVSTIANMEKMNDVTTKTLCNSCTDNTLSLKHNSTYYITENGILGFCPSCNTPAMKRLDRLDTACRKCTHNAIPHNFVCSYCGSNFVSDITDKTYKTIKDFKYACASCTEEILQYDSFEDVAFSEIPPTTRNLTLLAYCTRCHKPMWKRIERLGTVCQDCKIQRDFTCSYCGESFAMGMKINSYKNIRLDAKFACPSCASNILKQDKNYDIILAPGIKGYINYCPDCHTPIVNTSCNAKCKICVSKDKQQPGFCTVCGNFSENRNAFGICPSCVKENAVKYANLNTKPGICKHCSCYSESRSIAGLCPTCHSENVIKISEIKSNFIYDIDCSEKCYLYGNCDKKFKKNKYGFCIESPNVVGVNFDSDYIYHLIDSIQTYEDYTKLDNVIRDYKNTTENHIMTMLNRCIDLGIDTLSLAYVDKDNLMSRVKDCKVDLSDSDFLSIEHASDPDLQRLICIARKAGVSIYKNREITEDEITESIIASRNNISSIIHLKNHKDYHIITALTGEVCEEFDVDELIDSMPIDADSISRYYYAIKKLDCYKPEYGERIEKIAEEANISLYKGNILSEDDITEAILNGNISMKNIIRLKNHKDYHIVMALTGSTSKDFDVDELIDSMPIDSDSIPKYYYTINKLDCYKPEYGKRIEEIAAAANIPLRKDTSLSEDDITENIFNRDVSIDSIVHLKNHKDYHIVMALTGSTSKEFDVDALIDSMPIDPDTISKYYYAIRKLDCYKPEYGERIERIAATANIPLYKDNALSEAYIEESIFNNNISIKNIVRLKNHKDYHIVMALTGSTSKEFDVDELIDSMPIDADSIPEYYYAIRKLDCYKPEYGERIEKIAAAANIPLYKDTALSEDDITESIFNHNMSVRSIVRLKNHKDYHIAMALTGSNSKEFDVDELIDSMPVERNAIIRYYYAISKMDCYKPEYTRRIEEIAARAGISIDKRCFIESYAESKKFMASPEFNLKIYDPPVVLDENYLKSLAKDNPSIVWDLCDTKTGRSIYVGECREARLELETLRLYISRDKDGTIQRRSDEYGYSEIQPLIDRIFKYDFCVRLLAIGATGDSRSVRAYESVWNEECNGGLGCVEKQ